MLPRFSCGIRLDYLLLEHVVFSDDLDFCLWEMLQQETLNRFLVVLILIGPRAGTNNERLPWRQYFHALGFQLLPILVFSSNGIRVLNVKSWGGKLSMT